VKASDGLDEVAEGAAKPVEAPDNENVTWFFQLSRQT
jgi:hypothetical protein